MLSYATYHVLNTNLSLRDMGLRAEHIRSSREWWMREKRVGGRCPERKVEECSDPPQVSLDSHAAGLHARHTGGVMNEVCVYLDWAGWKAEVWVGILQAAVAGIAIYAAGRLATKQHRMQIAQRVGAVVALLAHVADLANGYSRDAKGGIGGNGPAHWTTGQVKAARDALAKIAVHDLPDEMLVDPVLSAADAAGDFCALLDTVVSKCTNNFALSQAEADRLEVYAERIGNAYGDAVEVDRRYRPLTRVEKKVIH